MKLSLAILLIILINSCEEKNSRSIVRLNHFETISVGEGTFLCPQYQAEEDFGTNNWISACGVLKDFNFERGHLYELWVEKKYHDEYLADGPQFYFNILEVISKTKVGDDKTFEYRFKFQQGDQEINYLTGDLQEGFVLLHDIEIECENWCNELSSKLESENQLSGVFKHAENGKIRLIGLRSE